MPETPSTYHALFRGTLNASVVLIGLASGVAQLAEIPTRIGQWALTAISLACLLYFVVRLWQLAFVVRIRDLKADLRETTSRLALQQAGHQHYLDAIQRISDREKPLFTETLEVLVAIGADDDSDRIVEKRVTTPEPLVTHRTMRPIVPTDTDRLARLDEISFKTLRPVGGTITALPLEQTRLLRVWLIFDPAMTTPTEWQVEYRPRGLWRPLRERGWDQLVWEDRLPTASGTPSAFTRFQVTFSFPDSDQPPSVKERQGYGQMSEPERDARGRWEVVWRDEKPAGRRYVWDLTQAVGGH
ncbi:hypothetical protein KZ829_05550 [Actinoplanes hulinensis]|uniref:Uncharacterized protein n=2 Tax=Actinoplanes TaxID=1865 RepID=A0A7W5AJJ8_9ACTN|nr:MULTISPECIES: hypothetical protein [Actinoplanes]MBB3097290.1 hypothetical protein [Actinoplanes campanulatus]MBW6433207.1 hypothetical protein [Actinoplanes hulinensis]GGN17040.1 hypothetical protein GCM10010109_29490 [Actinoplanes campanulatus]GID37527.1 hypothetical protein Aca09nite_40330 [Actinoplanes campanulatus]GID43572.1 hypothetical protein Aca07nite_08470 [Actinoplanes capillaceus]